jgi:hypothetical protein
MLLTGQLALTHPTVPGARSSEELDAHLVFGSFIVPVLYIIPVDTLACECTVGGPPYQYKITVDTVYAPMYYAVRSTLSVRLTTFC